MNAAIAIFIFSLALAILLFWYFATEDDAHKRWVGTALAVGVTVFCLLGIFPLANIGDMIAGKKTIAQSHTLKPGIDIAGGSSFTLQIQNVEGKQIGPQVVEQAIGVIRKRLNDLGTSDMIIGPRGTNQIFLQMPGVKEEDREAIREQLKKAAKLDFHLVHPNSAALVKGVQDGGFEPGYELKEYQEKDRKGNVIGTEYLLITSRPDLPGTFVEGASAQNDPTQGWLTSLSFSADGRKRFGDLTREHVGDRLAVVLDGVVVSAPSIRTAILNGSAQVTGMGGQRAAMDLASALQNPLEAPLDIIEERSVSSTLGEDAIKQGILSGVVGLLITIIFLLFYYRLAGFVAFIGLTVNIIVLFGIMAMFQFTFTLPGIAGIILTIGMAVDSNVLIYERLKEELAAGKSLATAIHASYDKAFSAIFDSNITTLLTGAVLFWLATDAIRGFAVTLVCGILGTMFAALLVTRVCFRWLTDRKILHKLVVGKPMRNMNIDFMKMSGKAARLSIAMTVIAIATVVYKGNDALSIDFKGGDMITFKLTPETMVTVPDIEKALGGAGLTKQPIVQEMATPGTEDAILSVSVENGKGADVVKHLRGAIPQFGKKDAEGRFLVAESTDSVGPTMGKELLTSSGWAMALGLLAILVYLTVRFEFAFALGAIVALVHDLIFTVGLMMMLGREFSAGEVGALLTIAGYSVNDTIVVFDRIRENLTTMQGDTTELANEALNSTLSRTLLTSLTTLFILTFMSIFGGPSLRDFSICLIIGIVVGTFSSIYVASSFVLWWSKITGKSLRQQVLDAQPRTVPVEVV